VKNRNIVILLLVLVMLIVAFAACTATRTQESTVEYVDDSVITNKVKALLGAEDFFKSLEISVESFKGTVQLSGFANSQKAVDKAGAITKSVKGIKSIKNDLIVK
jgi:osmotically-inducible protein OsmY